MCNSYTQRALYRQFRGPYRQGVLWRLYNFCRQGAHKYKRHLHTKGPYRQEALIDAVQFLHIRGPYKKGPLHDIHARLQCASRQGPLTVSNGHYITYRQGLHTAMHGHPKDKSPPRRGPYSQSVITEKGSLHTKDPYRQWGTADKGPLQTKDPHRQ